MHCDPNTPLIMATLFDLPAQDVIFVHIFSYLEDADIWRLREVCRELCELCWDYFINVCTSISIKCTTHHMHNVPILSLGVGSGCEILQKCMKIQDIEITDSAELDERNAERYLVEVLTSLIRSGAVLKRLHVRLVNAGSMVPFLDDKLLDGMSNKCQHLLELELCGTAVKEMSAQHLLSRMLQHCKNTLQKLSLQHLVFSPNQPLPIASLTSLRHFSVAYCHNVSSEACLEEVFRKCLELEVVDLRGVRSVNRRSLLALAEYCTHLKQLFVEGCPKVTLEPLLVAIQLRGVILDGVILDIPAHKVDRRSVKIPGQI